MARLLYCTNLQHENSALQFLCAYSRQSRSTKRRYYSCVAAAKGACDRGMRAGGGEYNDKAGDAGNSGIGDEGDDGSDDRGNLCCP